MQHAFDHAAAYVGKESPKIVIDRDFNLQTLEGNAVGQYMNLFNNGVITQSTLLEILRKGECLPTDFDIELEVELTDQNQLNAI